ncbi:MAG: DEAD/DEAH box helicase family protein [Oscillospiraceae bacterium]|nr:DEAD/DEAH box helicase family protein [Oscillospiraceae bacterium]
MFAEIIINKDAKQLNKVFDYIVPKQFEKEIRIGARVSVSFAKNKKAINGFVVALKSNSEFANKEIISIENNYLTEKDIKLAELMARRYFCNVSECIKLMLPAGTKEKEKKIKRVSLKLKDVEKDTHHKLNAEQQIAFNRVNEAVQKNINKEFLLYGVTGSGKTEVYLQLLDNILKKEKSAIVLVPEISLTPQIINRFIARFGENEVAVLHSKLTTGQRFDAWHKVHSGEAKIVIGARSAIFAPARNLGLVIIDEEHDSSYKSDMTPRFNAKEIARYLCRQNNAPLLLGSATPDLNTFYRANLNMGERVAEDVDPCIGYT